MVFDSEETVTITRVEYERLVAAEIWLGCLEAAGVDNWSGFSYAHEIAEQE